MPSNWRIDAFEMYLCRRILLIWVDRITNEEVLRRIGKGKEVLTTISSNTSGTCTGAGSGTSSSGSLSKERSRANDLWAEGRTHG